MKYDDVKQMIYDLKKREGRLLTNIVGDFEENEMDSVYTDEAGIAFVVSEPHRKCGFYAVKDHSVLVKLLRQFPSGVVIECIHKQKELGELGEYFLEAGFCPYKKYIRTTTVFKKNPYTIPESGRRKMLQELYDPSCGEFPSLSDAEELYELSMRIFDPLTDDVFTRKQWEDVIGKKECLVYRENGAIISYFVWRLEGKKLYSNISLNQGAANWLYNMERRVFEKCWDEGIRIFYAWVDMQNKKAVVRENKRIEEAIQSRSILYNFIYKKM